MGDSEEHHGTPTSSGNAASSHHWKYSSRESQEARKEQAYLERTVTALETGNTLILLLVAGDFRPTVRSLAGLLHAGCRNLGHEAATRRRLCLSPEAPST